MLVSKFKALIAISSAALLTGCTAYSTAVNSLGPDRAVSDLMDLDDEYVLNPDRPLFCPAPECYMVLPEEGQGVIKVQLNNGEEYVLEGDYATICVTEEDRDIYVADEERMQNLFGKAIAFLPPVPIDHTVYFELDTTTLTPESEALIDRVLAEIVSYPAAEVVVVGHTDTQASDGYNLGLSQRRAELMRDYLVERGVKPEIITLEARGERDLLVKTADNVDEPLNRRVVITVR